MEHDLVQGVKEGLPFYRVECFIASPTYRRRLKMWVRDVQYLAQHRDLYPGIAVFFHRNHPIRCVWIQGVVTAITLKETHAWVEIDDSSGARMDVMVDEQMVRDYVLDAPPRGRKTLFDIGSYVFVTGELKQRNFAGGRYILAARVTVPTGPLKEYAAWRAIDRTKDTMLAHDWHVSHQDWTLVEQWRQQQKQHTLRQQQQLEQPPLPQREPRPGQQPGQQPEQPPGQQHQRQHQHQLHQQQNQDSRAVPLHSKTPAPPGVLAVSEVKKRIMEATLLTGDVRLEDYVKCFTLDELVNAATPPSLAEQRVAQCLAELEVEGFIHCQADGTYVQATAEQKVCSVDASVAVLEMSPAQAKTALRRFILKRAAAAPSGQVTVAGLLADACVIRLLRSILIDSANLCEKHLVHSLRRVLIEMTGACALKDVAYDTFQLVL